MSPAASPGSGDAPSPRPMAASAPRSSRLAVAGALALSCAALAVAVRWGAFVAGGSDSYCYIAQAGMWLDGSLWRPVSPGVTPGWNHAELSFAPVGFLPSPHRPGAIVPICPPGLALIMAGAQAVAGLRGAFAIVPICGAVLVWCAFLLGRRLAGPAAGLIGASLTVSSPIVLNQLVQPMSDVPAAAGWLAALVAASSRRRGGALAAGVATAAAVLVRPNLVLLAVPVAAAVALAGGAEATWRGRLRSLVWFAVGALPGALAVAGLNEVLYGSPLRSGYGDPGQLFAWRHVAPNSARYARWLIETQTAWVALGLLAPAALRRRATAADRAASPRWLAGACLLLVGVLCVLYTFYVVFQDWTYLRFLLPGVVILIVLGAAVAVRLTDALPRRLGAAALAVMTAGLAVNGVRAAAQRQVFDVHLSEARFTDAGLWVRDHLPAEAVGLSVWHSGSLRMYGRRFTVLWDAIDPAQLDQVIANLGRDGRPPFLLLESWEVPRFRERFAGASAFAALDWPPRAQIGRDIVVYDPADRARYFQGEPTRTSRVWTTAERESFRRR